MSMERVFAAILVGLQTFLAVEYSEDVGFGAAVGVACLLSIRFQFPIRRSIHLLLGLTAFVYFLMQYLWNPAQIQNDWLLPGSIAISAAKVLICFQLLELFARTGNRLPIRFDAWVMSGFLISYCRVLTSTNWFLFLFVSVSAVFTYALFWKSKQSEERPQIIRTVVQSPWYAVFATCLLIGTIYLSNVANSLAGTLRFQTIGRLAELQESKIARIAYSASGRLDDVTKFQQFAPDDIALRINCEYEPGYLRGRVFTKLGRFGWSRNDNRFRAVDEYSGDNEEKSDLGFRDANVFEIMPSSTLPYRKISVKNDENHMGMVTFTPNDSVFFSAAADKVLIDQNNVVSDGVDLRFVYHSLVAKVPPATILSDEFLRATTKVPNFLDPQVAPFAIELVKDCTSDRQIIDRVEQHFKQNYVYSLEPKNANGLDRISNLILNKTPSHCEYFATSAVVLLRLNGIPARYVTGFRVFGEAENDLGNLWYARNKDAHAWVEAFDRQRKQWVTVEATPGEYAPKSIWDDSTVSPSDILASNANSDDSSLERQSLLLYAKIRTWLRNLQAFSGPANVIVSIVFLGLVGWLISSYRQNENRNTYQLSRPAKSLRRLDRRLKQYNLVRDNCETLHQFASRLKNYAGKDQEWVNNAASAYLTYAKTRYRVKN